jgi:Flp pilus assembly protein TadD
MEGPFVFDDISHIAESLDRRQLDFSLRAWLGMRALPDMTFTLNYHWHGKELFGYHVVNVAFHVATSWVVFLLTRALTLQVWGMNQKREAILAGFFAGLIFVSHPLQTQAVSYIVQRMAVMAAFFYFNALWLYVVFRQSGKKGYAVLSVMATVAAMHCKEHTFTLPLAIALIEWMFFSRRLSVFRQRMVSLTPWLVTLLIIPVYMLYVPNVLLEGNGWGKIPGLLTLEALGERTMETSTISRHDYLLTQFRVVVTYIRLLFLPYGQNLDYDFSLSHSLWDWATAGAFLFLLAVVGTAWSVRRRWPLFAFGVFFFFLALSVESGLIPIRDVIFEHRLYLPMWGFTLVMVELFAWGWGKVRGVMNEDAFFLRHAWWGCAVALVVVFGWLTVMRNALWADDVKLWEDVAAKSPNKSRPYNNLGRGYARVGNMEKAIWAYEQEAQFNPKSVSAYNNLGALYARRGRSDDAREALYHALDLNPGHASSLNNLGNIYLKEGRFAQAQESYERGLVTEPRSATIMGNLAEAHVRQQHFAEAEHWLKQALALDSRHTGWRNTLGAIYIEQGRYDEAIREYEALLEIDPNYRNAYNNLAFIYTTLGKHEEAQAVLERASK